MLLMIMLTYAFFMANKKNISGGYFLSQKKKEKKD